MTDAASTGPPGEEQRAGPTPTPGRPHITDNGHSTDLNIGRALAHAGVPIFVAPPDPSTTTGYRLPTRWQHTKADPGVIDRWRPGWALCAVTGHLLDLVDIDPRNGGDRSERELRAAGLWPRAYAQAATPSGGRHDFVQVLGVHSRDNFRPGIDIKAGVAGDGQGFAFIPPTVRKSKVTGEPVAYRWLSAPDLDALDGGDTSGEALADLLEQLHGTGNGSTPGGTPFELPDRIAVGARDETLWRYACSLRGKGVKVTAAMRAMREAWKRCEQPSGNPYPWEDALEKIDRAWGCYEYTPTPDPPPTSTIDDGPSRTLHTVSIEEFAAVIEDGAGPLLGEHSQAVIAENSDVVIYGDGGASKTTLMIDLAVHWAAGTDWLGINVPRPVIGLIIENEGPRPFMRDKLNRKLAGWTGDPPSGRARILDEPWAGFTLANEQHRRQLADIVASQHLDVVVLGPLVCAGMEAAGTLQDVREFLRLLTDVRRRAGRRVTFILIHHENRAGKVSGAWEGATDTLLHVTLMGHGHTRLHIQKARWASDYHARTINLAWIGEDGFEVEDKPERTDEAIADDILTAVAGTPGIGWTKVAKTIPGVRDERRRAVRDRLLADGRLANVVKLDGVEVWLKECPERTAAHLFLPDDPTIRHLRPDPDADGTQTLWPASGKG